MIKKLKYWLNKVPVRIREIPAAEVDFKPQPHKWSKKEILGHLIDSATNNWLRFTNAQLAGTDYMVQPYAQDDLVRVNGYQKMTIEQVINLWSTLNQQIVRVWEEMPSEKLMTTVILPNSEKKTLKWLMEDYVVHLEHHLAQLFSLEDTTSGALPENWFITIETALKKLEEEKEGKRFVKLLEQGKMYVEIYVPDKVDLQTPHEQDEIYVIISGSGIFQNNGEQRRFQAGDVLFVPAGIEHRFENFTADFKTWVIFY